MAKYLDKTGLAKVLEILKSQYEAGDTTIQTSLTSHINNKSNPHGVTKSQVGLSNVANLDQSKAIKSITRNAKTFTYTTLDGTTGTFDQQDTTYSDVTTTTHGLMTAADKVKLNKLAFDSNNKIDSSILPSYVDDVIEGYYSDSKFYSTKSSDGKFSGEITGETGKIYVDLNTTDYKVYRYSGTAYVLISDVPAATLNRIKTLEDNYVPKTRTVNGHALSANVTVTKSDLGIGNVTNYDQSKAIKSITRSGTTFTATALDGTTTTFTQQDNNNWTALAGASSSADGTAGYAPKPTKGQQGYFLRGDATWAAVSKSTVGLGNVANYDQSKAIKSITRSGTTFTMTALDGTTSTFTQQDNGTSDSALPTGSATDASTVESVYGAFAAAGYSLSA